jgi:DNA-binding IclR family transcriptional regulator
MGTRRAAGRSGTQSIERATVLLREISARGQFGWQLSDLAARCRIGRSTAHRMLACLVRERLVKQRSSDRHYMPGPMLFELGLSLPELGELQHSARGQLAALARRTGGAAFLYMRSGDDFVCAARAGGAELKALTCLPGTRRPLVLSAGGVAILLALPIPEARAIIRRNLASLSGYDEGRVQAIRTMLWRTHDTGFAVNAGDTVPGVNGFAIALCDANGSPFASIAIAGPERTFPLERLPELRQWLQETAAELQETDK